MDCRHWHDLCVCISVRGEGGGCGCVGVCSMECVKTFKTTGYADHGTPLLVSHSTRVTRLRDMLLKIIKVSRI